MSFSDAVNSVYDYLFMSYYLEHCYVIIFPCLVVQNIVVYNYLLCLIVQNTVMCDYLFMSYCTEHCYV